MKTTNIYLAGNLSGDFKAWRRGRTVNFIGSISLVEVGEWGEQLVAGVIEHMKEDVVERIQYHNIGGNYANSEGQLRSIKSFMIEEIKNLKIGIVEEK